MSYRNTTNLSVVGKIDKAFAFNGSSDWVNLGTNFSTANIFSFAFWMVNKGSSKSYNNVWNRCANRNMWPLFGVSYGDSGYLEIIANTAANSAERHPFIPYSSMSNGDHMVFVQNYPTSTIYRNGSFLTNIIFTLTFSNVEAGCTTAIGRRGAYAGAPYFDGTLDDVRYYTNAISSNDVLQIYNGGAGTEADE